jgi:hypothetical protein
MKFEIKKTASNQWTVKKSWFNPSVNCWMSQEYNFTTRQQCRDLVKLLKAEKY